jgi:hypothetical protein
LLGCQIQNQDPRPFRFQPWCPESEDFDAAYSRFPHDRIPVHA